MIEQIFAWINFGLVAGLIIWVLKNKMLPWLNAQIAHYVHERDHLVSQIHEIRRSREVLDGEITREEALFSELSEKLELWRARALLKEQERLMQGEELRRHLTQRRARQQDYYVTHQLHELSKRQALNETEVELIRFFSSPERKELFMQRALMQLRGLEHE